MERICGKNSIALIIALLTAVLHHRKVLQSAAAYCSYFLATYRWRRIKKYQRCLPRVRSTVPAPRQPRVIRKRAKNDALLTVDQVNDLHNRTGLEIEQFGNILGLVEDDLLMARAGRRQSRKTLPPAERLLLFLHWLRKYLDYHTLAIIYNVSESFVCREIRHLLPILYARLNFTVPLTNTGRSLGGCYGAIDATAHQRLRVHPRSSNYYRGDKRFHLLVSQVIVQLDGTPADVTVALGHNNDQAVFNISGARLFVELNQINLLSDRGYTHHRLINPYNEEWDDQLGAGRVIVENTIAALKKFKALEAKFIQTPEMQACAIIIGYELVANTFKLYPIRQ